MSTSNSGGASTRLLGSLLPKSHLKGFENKLGLPASFSLKSASMVAPPRPPSGLLGLMSMADAPAERRSKLPIIPANHLVSHISGIFLNASLIVKTHQC